MAKVLISLDAALLKRIDRAAKAAGLSRSAYIAQLAQKDAETSGPGVSSSVRNALTRIDRLFKRVPPGDSTAEIRAERDSR
jgi:metal-responsive CopG/Arc/MetJ family transcriptional regulator